MAAHRTAIIHYWLVGMRGGERVLERLLHLYPDADIFTHVYVPEAMSATIRAHKVQTTFIQRLPGARRHYQKYLPLMPIALEQIDLRGYDLVISSESGPAKGVIVAPDAQHVCYCHSPMRYLWDHYPDYRASAGKLARRQMGWLFHYLRLWDTTTAARIDTILANSTFIRKRIRHAWGRDAQVVHPPVDVKRFSVSATIEDHYLWVGQMTAYKRADLVVDAFNATGLPLLMVGTGELASDIARKAGPNIRIIDRMNFDGLRNAYATCRALVFTAEEDFGIVPVEAMASGRPVLAYGKGGILDTVVEDITGLYFGEQNPQSLIETLERAEQWLPHFEPAAAVRQASRFSPEVFDVAIRAAIGR